MTTRRSDTYDPTVVGYYHCISRCVRRSFLCGIDSYTSKSYEHRKIWVRNRLAELINLFAIECMAYAVMSSHVHTLLKTRPDIAAEWSDYEVARRWLTLFSKRDRLSSQSIDPSEGEIKAITSQPKLILIYRARLSNLSWFNRCLNEDLAVKANAEDNCTGRFWQGRFKCILLEGDAAVLACSVYIDLNPIRAKAATTLEAGNFTSIQDRLRTLLGITEATAPSLLPIQSFHHGQISEEDYINLVKETGKIMHTNEPTISNSITSLLDLLRIKHDGWIENARYHSRLFHRVMAPIEKMRKFADKKGQYWLKGFSASNRIFG